MLHAPCRAPARAAAVCAPGLPSLRTGAARRLGSRRFGSLVRVAEYELGALPAAYRSLLERALALLGSDPRVLAVWLGGSVARGVADAHSDLDLLVATTDEGCAAFTDGWADWLGAITPTVLARRIPGIRGLYAVTPDWLRLDFVWEPRAALPTTFFRTRRLLLDRDGCGALVPPPLARPTPSADAVLALVEECFRIAGLLPVVVGRGDWLLGVEGVFTQRLLLYQLYQQANAPLPETGLKQWSSKLTAAQIARLASLPTGAATRDAVIAGQLAVARALLAEARPLAARLGVRWPDALEHATRAHLVRELGIDAARFD